MPHITSSLPPSSYVINACARAAHEVNKTYCEALGDNSQPSWEDAPDWQRKSEMNGVVGALAGNTPEQSHNSWFKEKIDAGWTYGETKDPEKKTHPCMVPYEHLPPEQKNKNKLFVTVVRAMAEALWVL